MILTQNKRRRDVSKQSCHVTAYVPLLQCSLSRRWNHSMKKVHVFTARYWSWVMVLIKSRDNYGILRYQYQIWCSIALSRVDGYHRRTLHVWRQPKAWAKLPLYSRRWWVIHVYEYTTRSREHIDGLVQCCSNRSASAQVPDKPALAWVACPGIRHRS